MHDVEALERRGWEALSQPGGSAFHDELTADEGLMVYVRRDDRWKLLLHQQSPDPERTTEAPARSR